MMVMVMAMAMAEVRVLVIGICARNDDTVVAKAARRECG